MNFKKYYINGNKLTIRITFRTERYWNGFMGWLTRITTYVVIADLIYREMVKNPPELQCPYIDPVKPITMDVREKMRLIRKKLS